MTVIGGITMLDNWEVRTYGIEGSDKWGRIAINVEACVLLTLDGCNFSLMFPEPITERRRATKEEGEKIAERLRLHNILKQER